MSTLNNRKRLSLIIPAYNKDKEVFQVAFLYVSQLKKLPYDWEIIVVDDASRDRTLREAIRSKKFNGNTNRIKIYSYDLNQGKGFALYYGFKRSFGDIVIFADADLDLPAQNLPTVLKYFNQNSAQITVGSKRHPDSQVQYPILRRFMSKCYQLLIKLLFNLSVSDTQVGIKAFRREVLADCFPRIIVKNFAFDLEILVVAASLGFKKIIEAPIILNYNFSSTINIGATKQILLDTLAIFYRKNILKYYLTPHYRLETDEAEIRALLLTNFSQRI
jgi:dolichol-phosphate mannosyltransferase